MHGNYFTREPPHGRAPARDQAPLEAIRATCGSRCCPGARNAPLPRIPKADSGIWAVPRLAALCRRVTKWNLDLWRGTICHGTELQPVTTPFTAAAPDPGRWRQCWWRGRSWLPYGFHSRRSPGCFAHSHGPTRRTKEQDGVPTASEDAVCNQCQAPRPALARMFPGCSPHPESRRSARSTLRASGHPSCWPRYRLHSWQAGRT